MATLSVDQPDADVLSDGPAATPPSPAPLHDWRSLLMADLADQATRRPWAEAVMTIGWVHLGFFLVCQAVYTAGVRAPTASIALWGAELLAVLAGLRLVAGPGWLRSSPAVGLIARVWITFLILSFNVASLNTLTGFGVDWFKLVWCTLSSFGFATMAWLFGARLLVPAFQMYFTGLLMSRFPEWSYVIYASSWCVAMQYIGWDLMKRRARIAAAAVEDGNDLVAAGRG